MTLDVTLYQADIVFDEKLGVLQQNIVEANETMVRLIDDGRAGQDPLCSGGLPRQPALRDLGERPRTARSACEVRRTVRAAPSVPLSRLSHTQCTVSRGTAVDRWRSRRITGCRDAVKGARFPSVPARYNADTGTHVLIRPGYPKQATFILRVSDGPDKGKTFVLDATTPQRMLAGTSASCQICLTDPSVSRRHAAFDMIDRRLRLTDLGSSNGTYVNGISIVEVVLDGGEFVRMGQTTIHVQMQETESATIVSDRTTFGRVVGASDEMRRLYPLCEKLAQSDVPVLIEGETGCGKEVLAESLHEMGPRASGPFVVFDCMAAPPNLLESALFGHEKGAFTGAVASRAGVFEQAHHGTLLIDEIGDLDISLQPKLLRALQRSEVQRIGGSKVIKVDVRVLAATRRNLDEEVQAGRFRDDLYFRLNVARIELPPLRRRRGDIRLLAQTFWDTLGGSGRPIPPDLMARLEAYSWPGNVRELYNTIARHLALGELAGDQIGDGIRRPQPPAQEHGSAEAADFIDQVVARALPLPEARQIVMEEFERRYLEHALMQHGGNVTRAAAAAGIARRYFHLLRARHTKPGG